MRSRYQPDGSVDYEADRMLEILRHADAELDRQQREHAQQMAAACASHDEPWTNSTPPSVPNNVTAMPTILSFVDDPIAELIKTPVLTPPIPGVGATNPNLTTPSS